MRILLINPWEGEVFPTPAIGYLQAALKWQGEDVTAVDLSGAFKDKDYDIVAVTFHSFSVKHAQRIREYYPGRLICGGHHPSALPDQMLSIGYDQVIIGEGENAIEDVIKGNTSNKVIGQISDINSIPVPDYTGLKFTGEMGMPVISSRGCPFTCSFCASQHFWDRKYRTRSSDSVLNELSHWIGKGFRTWMFEDDNFTIQKDRVRDICAGITEMGKFSWQCASRAETMQDEDIVRTLSMAGCKTVWLGIESFSQGSLDRCNKKTTVDKMITGINTLRKYGISPRCQFIIGLPGDTLEDINETARVIKKHNIPAGGNVLWILPGTEAYYKAKMKGFSDSTYLESGAPFYTYEQSMNTLQYWNQLIRN